jgi:hypothetical protein
MHWDNIDWSDSMDDWKNDPHNKKGSKAGDDRSPAFRWIGSVYHDGKFVTMPSDNVMRCIMEGGAMVPVPGGKSGKTFKSQTQSGIAPEADWELSVNGQAIPIQHIHALKDVEDFKAHRKAVEALGFSLFIKRAKIGTSKHVRVRPRFDSWSLYGTLSIMDEQITDEVLKDILTFAGQYKGLGDWRPGGKTPGPFGRFTVVIKRI